MTNEGRMSGERWNRIQDAIVHGAMKLRDDYVSALMASGYPPGTDPNTPYEQYLKLLAMRAANDPNFVYNQRAQDQLAVYALQFGAPPPLQVPYGQTLPGAPGQMAQQLQHVQGGP